MEVAEELGRRGKEGRHHNALFYADDGMVASSEPRWLQGDFIILVGLFITFVLWNNFSKIVGMVYRP